MVLEHSFCFLLNSLVYRPKPDAGKLTYDPTNLTRLQRFTKADGTQKNYTYDANGNMLQAGNNLMK
jgi:YD repeat-containing protein